MTWIVSLSLMLGGLVVLMVAAMPVAVAFFGINMVGAYLFLGGEAGLIQLPRNAITAIGSFSLIPIPLFILMGEILFHTGMAKRAVDAIDKLISRLPGRLGVVTIMGGTVFASLSGSTIANTAMLGSTLLPEMRSRGYDPTFAMGPIMGVGGIAMLIPPSSLAVVLGSLAGISIAKLLIAGLIPGLVMAALYFGYVIVRSILQPSVAPRYDVETLSMRERLGDFLVRVLPLFGIFFCVVGSILLGWATPTESAALGSIAAIVAALCYRLLSVRTLMKALLETAKLTAMIMFIIAASITFSQVLAISGAADGLLRFIGTLELSRLEMLLILILILLFLGCFMEQVSIMLITVPFYVPIANSYGVDLVWLGIMMLIAIELGLMSPPFGLLIYVMKGVAPDISIMSIYRAAVPYILMGILVIGLIMAFPSIAMWLPSMI